MKAISHTDAKVCVTEIMELCSLSLSLYSRVSFLAFLHTLKKKDSVISNYIVE